MAYSKWLLEEVWATQPVPSSGYKREKSAPSAPPAPDYSAAAAQTQKSQMSSQYTPYGSQVYSADPNSPSGYQSNITLAPQAQQTLDTQMGLSNQLGNLAQGQVGNVNTSPMDLSSVQGIADKAYGAMTSRLDPQWAARDQSQEAALRNQGLVAGDQAYDSAMRDYNNAKNDAYQQANLGAIQTMPQTYQLASSAYNQPLNYLNAIRTGAQIQNPTFQQTPGANYSSAAGQQAQYNQGLYNSQVGSNNSMMSGLFGLGASGLGAYGTYSGLAALA